MSINPVNFSTPKQMDRLPQELKPNSVDWSYKVAIMDLNLSLDEAVKSLSPELVEKVNVYAQLKFHVCKQLKLDAIKDNGPETFYGILARQELDCIEKQPQAVLANFVKAARYTSSDKLDTFIALFKKHLYVEEPKIEPKEAAASTSMDEVPARIETDSHIEKKQKKHNPLKPLPESKKLGANDPLYSVRKLEERNLNLSFDQAVKGLPLEVVETAGIYATLKLDMCKQIRIQQMSKYPPSSQISEGCSTDLSWIEEHAGALYALYASQAQQIPLEQLKEEINDLQRWLDTEEIADSIKQPSKESFLDPSGFSRDISDKEAHSIPVSKVDVEAAPLTPVIPAADKPLSLLKASQFTVLTFFYKWKPRTPTIENLEAFQKYVKEIYQKTLKYKEEPISQAIAKLPSVTAGEKAQFHLALLGFSTPSVGLQFSTGTRGGYDERGQTEEEASLSLDRQISDILKGWWAQA